MSDSNFVEEDLPSLVFAITSEKNEVDLLKHIDPSFTPAIAHVRSDNFKIESASVAIGNSRHMFDVDCQPDPLGKFSFDVPCGVDDNGDEIIDTVSGEINYCTGKLTVSTTRWDCEDNRVCSIDISGCITTFEEMSASIDEVFQGKPVPKCGFVYHGYCDAKTEEECESKTHQNKCAVDYFSVNEIKEMVDGWKVAFKAGLEKVKPEQKARYVIDTENKKDFWSKIFLEDSEPYQNSSTQMMYGINCLDILKVANFKVSPEPYRVVFDNITLGSIRAIIDGAYSYTDTVYQIANDTSDFSFDVQCGNYVDTISGNLDRTTGILTVKGSRCGEIDNKVYEIKVSGTVVVSEATEFRVAMIGF